MLIGILSDTHDRLDTCKAGIEILRDAGAEHLVHCGDVGGEMILDLLAGNQCTLVWGNNDIEIGPLTRYAQDLGITVLGNSGRVTLDTKRFLIAHGDRPMPIEDALENQDCDYVLHGHTHVRRDERLGKVHVINPGALHRAARKSVATLDLQNGEVRFHFVQ